MVVRCYDGKPEFLIERKRKFDLCENKWFFKNELIDEGYHISVTQFIKILKSHQTGFEIIF